MSHFQGKDALGHIKEKRLEGTLAEPHGLELPGFLFAFVDAAKQLSSLLLFLLAITLALDLSLAISTKLLLLAGLAFMTVVASRSAMLGWSRLERLHRLAEQERYEIEHHRPQERAELRALYGAKGFKGELLDKVVDVLMADDDRLLKVMLEEEMGLSLEAYEHPLKPALAIILSSLITLLLFALSYLFFPWYVAGGSLTFIIAAASLYGCAKEKNKMVTALVWNLATSFLAAFFSYFAIKSL